MGVVAVGVGVRMTKPMSEEQLSRIAGRWSHEIQKGLQVYDDVALLVAEVRRLREAVCDIDKDRDYFIADSIKASNERDELLTVLVAALRHYERAGPRSREHMDDSWPEFKAWRQTDRARTALAKLEAPADGK